MAKAKKMAISGLEESTSTFTIKSHSGFDELSKVDDSIRLNIMHNGFTIEVSGRDHEDDWKTIKLITHDLEKLFDYIREVTQKELT